MTLRFGTPADDGMLAGTHERRRALFSRAAAAGIDPVFVADHVSFHTGLGMDGLIQAATAPAPLAVLRLGAQHPSQAVEQMAAVASK